MWQGLAEGTSLGLTGSLHPLGEAGQGHFLCCLPLLAPSSLQSCHGPQRAQALLWPLQLLDWEVPGEAGWHRGWLHPGLLVSLCRSRNPNSRTWAPRPLELCGQGWWGHCLSLRSG